MIGVGAFFGANLRPLVQQGIKRLPVVDEEGRLVGMVGRGSIMQAMAQELDEDEA